VGSSARAGVTACAAGEPHDRRGAEVLDRFARNPGRWLGRCVLLALVVWCAGYAVWDHHDRAVWRARGVAATATVTDPSCGGRGSSVHLDVAGASRVVLGWCPEAGLRVGDRVAVVYDAAHPSEVRFVQDVDRTSGRAAAVVAGGTTVVLAALEWTWWRQRRQPAA